VLSGNNIRQVVLTRVACCRWQWSSGSMPDCGVKESRLDSMSSLEAISGFKLEIDIVQNIIKDYTHLANSGKTIVSIFVAMRGLTLQQNQLFRCPLQIWTFQHVNFLPCVSNFCLDEWQEIWDYCEGNKLHSIYPTVGIVKHSKDMSHYDSVLLNRLRIGHSRLTHSYLLCGDAPPTC